MKFFVIENQNKDEITTYQSSRYVSCTEAVWRILSFPIHERYPSVFHLSVHLENGQRVYFTTNNITEKITISSTTTLTAFFQLCKTDCFAKTLLYHEVPKYYTYNNSNFKRKNRSTLVNGYKGIMRNTTIEKVYTVHQSNTECFHLRLLLHTVLNLI